MVSIDNEPGLFYTSISVMKTNMRRIFQMKKTKALMILGILAFAVFTLTGCGTKTIDLNKYISVDVDGYDSFGKASATFDYDAFRKDYSDKIKLVKKDNLVSSLGVLSGLTDCEMMLELCVGYELDQVSNLSNGDVVTLNWECKDDLAKECFKCKLNYSNAEYPVKDLEEANQYNPFEHIDVSFSGTSPNGTITITEDSKQEENQYITFSADKGIALSNGENVTVKATISGTEKGFAEMFGEVLSETEHTYTVDSLAYYATEVSEIPSDIMDKMVSNGEDVFRSYVAASWSKPENLNSVSLEGNYFLTLKPGGFALSNNYLYLIYNISATNPDPEETIEYYYYVRYDNIMFLPDGTCSVDIDDCTTPMGGWFSPESFQVGNYTYSGYESLESLFNKCVTANIDSFNYTSSIPK